MKSGSILRQCKAKTLASFPGTMCGPGNEASKQRRSIYARETISNKFWYRVSVAVHAVKTTTRTRLQGKGLSKLWLNSPALVLVAAAQCVVPFNFASLLLHSGCFRA